MPNTGPNVAEYMRDYRGRNEQYKNRNNRMNSARGKALTRLAAAFPVEFGKFFKGERIRAGLIP